MEIFCSSQEETDEISDTKRSIFIEHVGSLASCL